MPWILSEYLLKVVFLGLLAYAALVVPAPASAGIVVLCLVIGVIFALIVAAWQQRQAGLQLRGRWTAYLLFLALESPRHVYTGIIGGVLGGVLIVQPDAQYKWLLPIHVLAGMVVGIGLAALRMVRHTWWRFGVGLGVATALVAAIIWLLHVQPELIPDANRKSFGLYLLLGLPFFYL